MMEVRIDRLNVDDSRMGLHGYSPVSYVDHGRPELGRAEHTAELNGVRYFFADDEQRRRFTADPARYEPAFGGWCAFGMTVDKRFRIDPMKFLLVDGRLLVFLNDIEVDARALWQQGDERELLQQAAGNWAGFAGR